ncbi:MAG TPA: hypothetical protein VEX12_00970 [Microbacterium sp.]|nr:hypothetical protein [Microbacterium sp.]
MADTSQRFVLQRLGGRNWVIRDHGRRRDTSDVIAQIALTDDDDFEVAWLDHIPLPGRYSTPEDAVADLQVWKDRQRGSTKPVPIPHFPPPASQR